MSDISEKEKPAIVVSKVADETRPGVDEAAEDITENVSKHSQEVSDHLKSLASAIKESVEEEKQHEKLNFDDLSLEQQSSRLEQEFIGQASKARTELPITRICLTGGPCAGKTTALAELSLMLS